MEHTILTFDQSSKLSLSLEQALTGLQELRYGGFLAMEYVWVDWKGCNRTDNVSETLLLQRALDSAASKITKARMNHV
jgi:hypothetical protein